MPYPRALYSIMAKLDFDSAIFWALWILQQESKKALKEQLRKHS